MRNHPDFPHDPFTTGNREMTQSRLIQNLDDLDLKSELAVLYSNANELFNSLATDISIPANQKAQTLATILAVLKEVLREKEVLYNITEVAMIEAALGKTLQRFPHVREAFLTEYQGHLKV